METIALIIFLIVAGGVIYLMRRDKAGPVEPDPDAPPRQEPGVPGPGDPGYPTDPPEPTQEP